VKDRERQTILEQVHCRLPGESICCGENAKNDERCENCEIVGGLQVTEEEKTVERKVLSFAGTKGKEGKRDKDREDRTKQKQKTNEKKKKRLSSLSALLFLFMSFEEIVCSTRRFHPLKVSTASFLQCWTILLHQ
jgi:hypothetical protein